MRGRGGYIGFNRSTTSTAASGIWTVREAEALRRAGEWPRGPAAPTGLTATEGNAQLSLSWTAPSTTHGTITNYLVEYTPSGGSASYVLTGSTSTSYTLTGLTNGTAYTVRVAAVNFTAGDWSGTATGTPSAAPTVTGGTISTPGDGYKYHTFTSSGTLAISGGSLTCDVLVVGAGGSGGKNFGGGGGGGGGVLYQTSQSITEGSHAVTVAGTASVGSSGGSSSIGALYSATGGALGRGRDFGDSFGGSSGGVSGVPTSTSNVSGNAGGAGVSAEEADGGGGGGGAGGAGGNGAPGSRGAAGAGRTVFGSTYGAGGIGGVNGGGATNGSANTGQGGSGGSDGFSNNGRGTGGSGIVIVRYLST
jgi:hypothetical protein